MSKFQTCTTANHHRLLYQPPDWPDAASWLSVATISNTGLANRFQADTAVHGFFSHDSSRERSRALFSLNRSIIFSSQVNVIS